jgi:Domain of unknown function (DUF4919)
MLTERHMTDAFLLDAYQAFLEEPTADNYRRARRVTLAEPGFDRQSLEWVELSRLCDEGLYEEVFERSCDLWPTWKLSPRFHLLMGYAASCLGDAEEVELCRFQFQTCLEGLLGTGQGTATRPYQVLHISDQYDVIHALGLRGQYQRAVQRKGRCLDVISCEDGTQVWFDVGPVTGQKRVFEWTRRWADQIPSQVLHHW